jgi:hypothetical protein
MDVKVDPSDDSQKSSFRMADKIGIGAAVTRQKT